ncbi:ZYRO0F00638p [Zygosaccharomyces rouxii]|uniref:Chromosome segregation in meiosis protein n=1 Tax=Zygosaccharomyces rouxii (strain ATCC 2623 / CBS 732 / NBRC 1130 / NCYC 568 / NRRL Y-229) TaxID=559307 RepID=C5DWY4_ZYGRC|nr:uncharacterized protein ZYRO0F00638g [Zygosaccharomyces rouxii]KAH9199060.1 replication fork protection component Swi3-domain-containing protein [Zygosaccharomyces rouxii]CAR28295.1 ZYRO0F00638p [Zygosaccharomyces rouxii]
MEDPMLMGLDPGNESADFNGNDNDRLDPIGPSNDDPTMADPTMAEALTKTRRVQPKLTSDILLSRRGLPYLVKNGPKRLRISTSRNKPYDNLSQIVQFYQLWAHELYPRAKFKDFIKLCQNMKNDKAVREYRTELCLREMNPSRYTSLHGDHDEDDDIYQESSIREPPATEKEPKQHDESVPSAETGAQQEEQDVLDTQEPPLDTQEPPLETRDEDMQEDEDAMEVMKELGF